MDWKLQEKLTWSERALADRIDRYAHHQLLATDPAYAKAFEHDPFAVTDGLFVVHAQEKLREAEAAPDHVWKREWQRAAYFAGVLPGFPLLPEDAEGRAQSDAVLEREGEKLSKLATTLGATPEQEALLRFLEPWAEAEAARVREDLASRYPVPSSWEELRRKQLQKLREEVEVAWAFEAQVATARAKREKLAEELSAGLLPKREA